MRSLVHAVTLAAAALTLAACSGGAPAAPASRTTASTPTAAAAPLPSPSCKLHTTFDYIERDVEPGLQPSAQEIGNVNHSDCTPTLQDFASTAGQADGECTTIALASDNPVYNPDATPAPPLRKVIEKAGPGC